MKDIVRLFTADDIINISPMGNGHINSTYRVDLEKSTGENHSIILQKINSFVFPDVDSLMENICSVTGYLRRNALPAENPDRTVMQVIPSLSGNKYEKVGEDYYRCLVLIEDTITYDIIKNPEDFFNCAAGFASFQKKLADFPAHTLKETIKDFHNTVVRYENLLKAVSEDELSRAVSAEKEIQRCKDKKYLSLRITGRLKSGAIPLRVVQNDAKLNNILFDKTSNRALCIVDLDTVMPEAASYDFGDIIRSGGAGTAEDEHNLSQVKLNMELFEACAAGYMGTAREFLTVEEIETFVLSPLVITYENALRFLTDYLRGDVYFGAKYPDQNLWRCRTHLKLVEDMEEKLPEMRKIIFRHAGLLAEDII